MTERRGLALALGAVLVLPSVASARACPYEGRGAQSVFFSNRPGNLPEGVIVLHVRTLPTAKLASDNTDTNLDVELIGTNEGARGQARIQVKVAPTDGCGADVLGVVGRPAFALGYYEQSPRGGPVYFRAMWLPARLETPALPPWRSFIVDPAVRAQAEKQ